MVKAKSTKSPEVENWASRSMARGYLVTADICEIFNVTPRTVLTWKHMGMPSRGEGRKVRYHFGEVVNWWQRAKGRPYCENCGCFDIKRDPPRIK